MGCKGQRGRVEDLYHCGGASGNNIGLHGDSPCIYNKNRNDQYDEETACMTVMARFGTGGGINDGKKMYTLNTTEVHGVIYELPKDNRSSDGK